MPTYHSPSLMKDTNDFHESKRGYLIILALLLCLPAAAIEKKHRRELPIPKKEKEGTLQTQPIPIESSTKARPRVQPPAKYSPVDYSNNAVPPPNTGKPSTKSPPICSEKFPIEAFMQIASATSPQATLRGGVFFISDLRETPQVYHLETPKAWPTQISFFPDGVRYFEVSPDGLKILMATDEGGNEQYDIFLLYLKSRKLVPLITGSQKRVESVKWDPTSQWFAYTSTERNQKDFDLYRFDIGSLKQILLSQMDGHFSISDISPDGNTIALQNYRSVIDADIFVYRQKEKELVNLTREFESHAALAHFTADGRTLFFLSDHINGISQLFTMALNNPSKLKVLTSDRWGVETVKLNKERDALIFSTNRDGYSHLAGFEIDRTGSKKDSLTLPTINNSVVGGFTPTGHYGKEALFFTQSSSKKTSDIWLWRRNSAIQWTQSTQGPMNNDCFLSEMLIRYPSFDKKEIPAFVYLPKGLSFDEPSPVPFIVYIHGGPESQFRPSFNKTFQYFLQHGFGIFAPNIRGSTGYGREYTSLDNYKKRMDSIQDIIEGTRWLLKNQFTQTKALSIYGGSYGGFAVLRTIQVEPNLFASASESVGISNFVTFLQNTKPYRRALREIEYGPLSDSSFLKTISPIHYVDSIKTPLLVFHGANDPRVPLSETEQIVEALKKRNIPIEFTVFRDEGHGNRKLTNITLQAKQMALFFEKYKSNEDPR